MDPLSPDRVLNHLDGLPPAPEAVSSFLAGDVVTHELLVEAVRVAFPSNGTDIGERPWWEHALAVAEGAAVVAESTGRADPKAAYVAGLLHDVGHLVMLQLAPSAFHKVLARQQEGRPFLALEREVFGLDHVRAGEHLLRRWELPDDVCRAAREHHLVEGEIAPLIASVVLADAWAQVLGYGYDFPTGGVSFRVDEAASAAGLIWGEQLTLLAQVDIRIVARELALGLPKRRGFLPNEEDSRRALWVSVHADEPTPLGRLLLQHRGYDLVHVASTANLEPQEGELLLIDSPWAEPDEVGELVSALVPDGGAHVALMADPKPGRPGRRRDTVSGICGIPLMFTAFDLRWLQSCPVVTS